MLWRYFNSAHGEGTRGDGVDRGAAVKGFCLQSPNAIVQ